MLISHSAFAEGYFGAGGSTVSGTGIKTGISAGIIAGINITDNFAAEIDIDTSVIKPEANTSSVKINYQTTALYAAYRSNGSSYLKAKVGFHSTEVSASGAATNTVSAIAYGIGMGFGDGYEIEYTHLAPETGSGGLNKISFHVLF